MSITELLLDSSMRIPIYIFIFILGIWIGSFLNVLIYRIPKKEEFVKTSSHCMMCQHKLAWYDNIPLISWLALRGKCRYCKGKISPQYPIVEAANGLMWLLIFLLHGISIDSLLIGALASGLLALSVIDWRTYEIHNGFHIYICIIAAIRIALDYTHWLDYTIGFFCVSLVLLLIYLISGGRAIGGGDVKLMAACGLFLGWKNIILALGIGCVVGSVVHIIRMKISKADHVLAMGPYLAIGVILSSLFGNQLIEWYLSFLTGP
jgi:leader peptidase (prepilin peptidase)/N-methyltransferase